MRAVFLAYMLALVSAFAVSAQNHDATAEQITLSKGTLTVSGDFLSYDGTYLRIASDFGELTLAYNGVDCEGAACPDHSTFAPTLRISGPDHVAQGLIPSLIEAYAHQNRLIVSTEAVSASTTRHTLSDRATQQAQLHFETTAADSAESIANLLTGDADISLSTRRPTQQEEQLARDTGLGPIAASRRSEILALDAVVPVISARNPLTTLSMEQIAGALAGDLHNWRDFTTQDAPIKLHMHTDQAAIEEFFTPPYDAQLRYHSSRDRLSLAVGNDPRALGITHFGRYGTTHPVLLSDTCGGGVTASRKALKTGDYPLTTPIFLLRAERRTAPQVNAWITWLRSDQAQKAIKRAGFVDRGIEPIPLSGQGERIARAVQLAGANFSFAAFQDMVRKMAPRDRLTMTFRFDHAASHLDARAHADVLQLATQLRDGTFSGKTLTLIGFSDGVGSADENLAISESRVTEVYNAISNLLGGSLPTDVTLNTEAYGEMLPNTCDETEWGRASNRRVELWVDR